MKKRCRQTADDNRLPVHKIPGCSNTSFIMPRQATSFIFFSLFFLFFSVSLFAATKTWTGAVSTDWNTAGNWSASGVPGAADDVIIPTTPSGGRMPVITSGTISAKSVTIQAGASLTQSGGTLTISGANIDISGNFSLSAGTWLCANPITVSSTGTINISGTGIIHMASAIGTAPTDHFIIDAGGVMNLSGGSLETRDFTTNAGSPGGALVQTGGTLKMYHDFKNNGSYSATGGTIQFSGSGGGGTFPVGVTSSNTQFRDVIIDAGVDPGFGANAITSINVSGNWTNNSNSVDLSTKNSTVIFNGSSSQTIAGSQSTIFRNLTINKPSGTLSLGINCSVQSGDLIISGGTTDLGLYTLNRTGAGGTMTIGAGCILKLANNTGGQAGSNFPLNFSSMSVNSNSTIEYYGSNALTQTIYAGVSYGNLTLTNGSGSGFAIKNTTANITVDGTLAVNMNAILNPGASNTVGGTGTLTGSGTAQVTRTTATADFNNQYTIANKTLSALTVDYNATGAQVVNALNYYNLSISGARTTNNVTLSSGTITISGTFNPTASFTSGNYITTGNTVDFNSSSNQNIPAFTFNNLTVSGGGAKTATGLIIVNSTFNLASTVLTTTSTNLIVLNDNATVSGAALTAYVNGPVKKTGNDAFTFPVGKAGAGYMPVSISAPSSVTDAFTAEYMRNSATALGSISATGLFRVSNCDYWNLNRVNGNSSVNVTLSWNGYTNCSIAAYVNNLSALTVAHFNGVYWDSYGVNSSTGNASNGTITRNAVSVFSPFAIGSTDDYSNPLQVHIINMKAAQSLNGNRVSWTNLSESGINGYVIERSFNGIDFSNAGEIKPASNDGSARSYVWEDDFQVSPVTYYRVNAVSIFGETHYSTVVSVKKSELSSSLLIYPNPVKGSGVSINAGNTGKGVYTVKIFSNLGQLELCTSFLHTGGDLIKTIELPSSTKKGVYNLRIESNGSVISSRQFVIQ